MVSQAEVSAMRAKVAKQQRINYHLHSELNTIESGARNAERSFSQMRDNLLAALETARDNVTSSDKYLVDSYRVQGEIREQYKRFKALEYANKMIRDCNNKKFYDFAHYRNVRKIVQGFLENMDQNLLTTSLIYKAVEKEHLVSPDYWLTYSLLAIMAWYEDDRDFAELCLDKAMEYDIKSTSLFFMLFNMKIDRINVAMEWFNFYTQQEQTGKDDHVFLMLISFLSQDMRQIENKRIREGAETFLNQVLSETIQSDHFDQNESIDWIKRYFIHSESSENLNTYTILQNYCTEYKELIQNLISAHNNRHIFEIMKDIGNPSEEQSTRYVNDCVDHLIADPNATEKAVYDDIEYYETVILCEGDIDLARKMYKEQKKHDDDELNLVKEMVHWIYQPKEEVSDRMRLNMFHYTKPLHKTAIDRVVKTYRSRFRTNYNIKINDYSSNMNLTNSDEEKTKIKQFYDGLCEQQLSLVNNKSAYLTFVIAALFSVGIIAISMPLLMLLVPLCLIGVGILMIKGNESEKVAIKNNYDKKAEQVGVICDQLVEDYKSYLNEFRYYDDFNDQIVKEIDQI